MSPSKPRAQDVELDLGRYELRRSGSRIRLEKKPMELLILLVSRREQLVAREEIVKHLWKSDLFVDTERSINNMIRKIRTALGEDVENPRFLETVIGKGYRFVGPIRVIAPQHPRSDSTAIPPGDGVLEVSVAEHASIAVVPLIWLGKESDDPGLGLGFADALVTRLGNLRDVDVLPASAGMSISVGSTPEQAAASLGVRFLVHGAIQIAKGRQHLSLEMLDSYRRRICFSRRYELDSTRLAEIESGVARLVAGTLNRSLSPQSLEKLPRYSKDPLAYAEFIRGYRLSAAGDTSVMDKAAQHLSSAVTRDPGFALAHATLAFACATRHFEFDPANSWLEKAEFHCRRALEISPDLPEAHVARAFLLWGPSKNFQHVEAITDLKRAIRLQANLPHAYNRLGTILAHIGLLDHSREMFHRARQFHPRKTISPSIVQVYVWNQEHDNAREQTQAWLAESPNNKYANYFAPQPAILTGDWDEGSRLVDQALQALPDEPMIISLQGVLHALMGRGEAALDCITKACSSPKSFGHAHHTYYQIACILAITERCETAFEWLDRSVSTGFACWPFFLKDPCLNNLHGMPEFEMLVSTLQAKHPDHLGLL